MAMLVYWRVYIHVPVVTLIIDPIVAFWVMDLQSRSSNLELEMASCDLACCNFLWAGCMGTLACCKSYCSRGREERSVLVQAGKNEPISGCQDLVDHEDDIYIYIHINLLDHSEIYKRRSW